MSASFKLTSAESLRACGILEESIEKMSFLGSITPDILQHREELSQVVGEEISRIIQEQRQLEAKYEKLIAQRTVLKGLANKSKFKENQREIQEISRQLRESTKSLCRNLKENPNFAGNLMKIQQERAQLIELLYTSYNEISKFGTFENLRLYVNETKQKFEKTVEILKKEKEALDEVKKLQLDLQKEKNDHQKEMMEYKTTILSLKEQLIHLKTKTSIDLKYAKNEAKAKRSSTARMYRQLIEEQETKNHVLHQNLLNETQVHEETCDFLQKRQEQLTQQVHEWTLKSQQEISQKKNSLQHLQTLQQKNVVQLQFYQKKWQDEMDLVQKKHQDQKTVIQLENLKKEQKQKQQHAVNTIQMYYQQYRTKKKQQEIVTTTTTTTKKKKTTTTTKKKGKK